MGYNRTKRPAPYPTVGGERTLLTNWDNRITPVSTTGGNSGAKPAVGHGSTAITNSSINSQINSSNAALGGSEGVLELLNAKGKGASLDELFQGR